MTSAAEALQEQAAGVSRLEARVAELEEQAAAAGDSLATAKASTWQMLPHPWSMHAVSRSSVVFPLGTHADLPQIVRKGCRDGDPNFSSR